MTTIKITGTLNFNDEGILLKSEFMGFEIIQCFIESIYPDSYIASYEDVMIGASSLPELIASIIEHLYEKAI